jgi:hypothetical protein
MRRCITLVLAVLAIIGAVVAAGAPAPSGASGADGRPAAPRIRVEPAGRLRDFTRATVSGGGFTPGGRAWVGVCTDEGEGDGAGGEAAVRRCDVGERTTVTADGRIGLDLGVWSDFEPTEPFGAAAVDCREAPGCVVLAADEGSGRESVARLRFRRPDRPRGRYLEPVFDEVTVDQDVVYRHTVEHQGTPVELSMNVYRPAGDRARRRPAIVWMHGGWFVTGVPGQMHA